MLLQGFLRNLAGRIIGQNVRPVLGLDADGGIFATITAGGGTPTPATITITSFPVLDASDIVIAANANRRVLEFINSDPVDTIYLNFEGVAATVNDWPLYPMAHYAMPLVSLGAVTAINGTAAGTASLRINEGV